MVINVQTMTDVVIQDEQEYIVPTYQRPPFLLVYGDGVYLYDSEGNAYMDWVAGIAVNALGYGDLGLATAMQSELASGIIHVSNLYHTTPHVRLARMLVENSFADRVFFCNSGAEANEAALKFARKFAYERGHANKTDIVTFSGGFHGRTMGALAMTPREKYQKPFEPMLPGVTTATFNDIESAREAIGPNTAAVVVEPIQGEGGINPADPEFLKALRQFCNAHEALLIFDEIQCGVGRSGTLWAHEPSGVKPDMMTLAKPLAGGLPIGATLVTGAVSSALQPGDHGSTFAAGPLVTSVAIEVLERVNQPAFLSQVRQVGGYLKHRLENMDSPLIKEVRGQGLMLAMELAVEAKPIIRMGYERGLLLVNAGPNVLRFVPPLIVERDHVDLLIERLTPILAQIEQGR
jgi:acetylornithine/N-succinyldiaminopimelate aminotransferase